MSKDSDRVVILTREYNQVCERLQQQRETLNSLSNNGYRMARLVIAFITVIITIPTLVGDGEQIINALSQSGYSKAGLVAVLISISSFLLAAIGERIFVQAAGEPDDIDSVISDYSTEEEHLIDRLNEYQDRINHNRQIIDSMGLIMVIGGIGILIGVMLLGYEFFRSVSPTSYSTVGLGFLLLIMAEVLLLRRKIPTSSEDSPDEAENEDVGPTGRETESITE